MERTNNKRPADSEQTVDTFAVCSNCSRLSYNLKQCDKCGNPLSEDNASMCVSAEPKRSRLESPATTSNGSAVVNGNSTGEKSRSSSPNGDVAIVPQALYVNKNAVTSLPSDSQRVSSVPQPSPDPDIRPQALYVNVNNQLSRVGPTQTTDTNQVSVLSTGGSTPTSGVANTHAVTVNSLHSGSTNTVTLVRGASAAPPPLVSTTVTPSGATTSTFSTFNLPPPPTYNMSSNTPQNSANADPSPDDNSNSLIGELTISADSVAMPATQIRIGTRKFLPASSVTFKEDGVLFALKANLKKCITIFPNLPPSTSKDVRIRMTATIRKIFGQMASRYPRPGAYLNEIPNMETIDILFDSMRSQRTSDVIPRGNSPNRPHTSSAAVPNNVNQSAVASSNSLTMGGRSIVNVSSTRLPHNATNQGPIFVGSEASRLPASSNMIRFQIPSRDVQSVPQPQRFPVQRPVMVSARPGATRMVTGVRQATTVTATSQPSQPAAKSTTPMTGTTAPLLVMPSDNNKWREMQRDLVEGGVYHVELPNKDRKYYLWDGTRLVPCLVQNTEIQLNCIYCRIGSLRAEVTNAKVRADDPSGITCTIKSDHTGQVPLNLELDMISSVTTCFENNTCIMFVSLNYTGWWSVQNTLKLGGETDPCFNPNALDVRRKHLVFIFKSVNQDQRDALLGIKHKYGGTSVFMLAPSSVVYKMMSDIVRSVLYIQGRSAKRANSENPLQEFLAVDRASLPADDDDDDVIMTSEEVGIKCPYTQQVMKDPVKNLLCEHNYEKTAIQEFIVRRKGNAKCPYAGCGNTKPLSMLDLEENKKLRDYITKNKLAKT